MRSSHNKLVTGRLAASVHAQRGVAAMTVAILLIFLLTVVGLALDMGQLFVAKAELENAMDACALAAARELNTTGTTEANRLLILTRAESAGIALAGRNKALFQSEAVSLAADRDVTFSAALAGPYVTKAGAPLNTQFVRCTTRRTGIAMWVMGLFGHGTENVTGMAAASLQPAAAACILPVGICKAPGVPLEVGQWYPGKFKVPCDNGVCDYLNIEGLTNSASELRDALQGPGLCGVSIGSSALPAKPGNMQTLAEAWNSRFGIYKKCGASPNPDENAPDETGFAFTQAGNWPGGSNAFQAAGGFLDKRTAHAGYDGSDKLDIKNSYKCILGASELGPPQNKGQDRRLVYLPIIDCPWDGHSTTVRGTACVLLLTPMEDAHQNFVVEYLGDETSMACATWGPPGGGGATGPRVPTLVQ
jgi:Flp pilus assembly protein TadG